MFNKIVDYPRLFQNLVEGIIVMNNKGDIVDFNQSALSLLGVTHEQILGKNSFLPGWEARKIDGSVFSSEEYPSIVCLRTQRPVQGIIMGVRIPQQTEKWLRLDAFPVQLSDGNGAVITFTEITELIHLSNENKMMLETLGIGIWKCWPKIDRLHWTQSLETMFELKQSGLINSLDNWSAYLAEGSRAKFEKDFKEFLESDQDWIGRYEAKTALGKKKIVGLRGTKVKDVYGEVEFAYGVMWDRTREEELAEKIESERIISMHKSKLALLGEMAASFAHEINNPLNAILGSVLTIKKYLSIQERELPALERLEIAADRLMKISKNFQRFSRLSAPQPHRLESVKALIDHALMLSVVKARRYSVSLEVNCAEDLYIQCNGVEMEQVLINLIINGIDAVRGLKNASVKVEARTRNSKVEIDVIDSGAAISKEFFEQILEPFFTTKSEGEGTGLGLYLAKGILDRHHFQLSLIEDIPTTGFRITSL